MIAIYKYLHNDMMFVLSFDVSVISTIGKTVIKSTFSCIFKCVLVDNVARVLEISSIQFFGHKYKFIFVKNVVNNPNLHTKKGLKFANVNSFNILHPYTMLS